MHSGRTGPFLLFTDAEDAGSETDQKPCFFVHFFLLDFIDKLQARMRMHPGLPFVEKAHKKRIKSLSRFPAKCEKCCAAHLILM